MSSLSYISYLTYPTRYLSNSLLSYTRSKRVASDNSLVSLILYSAFLGLGILSTVVNRLYEVRDVELADASTTSKAVVAEGYRASRTVAAGWSALVIRSVGTKEGCLVIISSTIIAEPFTLNIRTAEASTI